MSALSSSSEQADLARVTDSAAPFMPELDILVWQGRVFATIALAALVIGWWSGNALADLIWQAPVAGLIAMVLAGKLMHRGLAVIATSLVPDGDQEAQQNTEADVPSTGKAG